jgi:hypothetical protein
MEIIKKELIKSNLPSQKGQFSFMVGKFQPMTDLERKVVYKIIHDGGKVCLGVMDEYTEASYPLTALEVMGNLMTEFEEYLSQKQVVVMVVPSISSVVLPTNPTYSICEYRSNSL